MHRPKTLLPGADGTLTLLGLAPRRLGAGGPRATESRRGHDRHDHALLARRPHPCFVWALSGPVNDEAPDGGSPPTPMPDPTIVIDPIPVEEEIEWLQDSSPQVPSGTSGGTDAAAQGFPALRISG